MENYTATREQKRKWEMKKENYITAYIAKN